MIISLIAALARDHAIGIDGGLPWHLPADLKRFKVLTLGKPMLMGRKTAKSLGRALPGRRHLVLTRSGAVPFAGMEAVASVNEARRMAQADGAAELAVIGGGDVFRLLLPYAHRMHLTWVETTVPGADAFFPRFDASQWVEIRREVHPVEGDVPGYVFVDYARAE